MIKFHIFSDKDIKEYTKHCYNIMIKRMTYKTFCIIVSFTKQIIQNLKYLKIKQKD